MATPQMMPKHSNHESSIAHMMSSVMRESKKSSYVNFVERKKLHNPMRQSRLDTYCTMEAPEHYSPNMETEIYEETIQSPSPLLLRE